MRPVLICTRWEYTQGSQTASDLQGPLAAATEPESGHGQVANADGSVSPEDTSSYTQPNPVFEVNGGPDVPEPSDVQTPQPQISTNAGENKKTVCASIEVVREIS